MATGAAPTPPPVVRSDGSTLPFDAELEAAPDRFIDAQLARTRRHLRLVDLAVGLVVWTSTVIGALLGLALFDHWIAPLSPVGRWLALAGWIGLALYTGWKRLLPPLVREVNPAYAALLIEDRGPSLHNSLINYLFLRKNRAGVYEPVYQSLERRAAGDLRRVPWEQVFDHSQALRWAYVLAGLLAVCGAYKILSPKDPLQTAARVFAPWAELARPSRVELRAIEPGDAERYHGQRLEISVDVRGLRRDETPRVVWSTLDGQTVEQSVELPPTADGLRYAAVVPPGRDGVRQSLRYRIEAGDAASREFLVTALPTPTIVVEQIEYSPPRYTGLPKQTIAGQGDVRGVEGARVTLTARSSLPMKSAYLEFDPQDDRSAPDPARVLHLQVDGTTARQSFTLQLQEDRRSPLHASYKLRFTTLDGLQNELPVRHTIEVQPDLAPEVEFLAPRRQESTVRVDGRLSVELRAVDPDFGIARLTLRADRDGATVLEERLVDDPAGLPGQVTTRYELRPAAQQWKAGDEIQLWAEAADNRVDPKTGRAAPNLRRTDPLRIRVIAADAAGDPSGAPDAANTAPAGNADPDADPRPDSKPGDDPQRPETAPNGKPASKPAEPSEQKPQSKPPSKPQSKPNQAGSKQGGGGQGDGENEQPGDDPQAKPKPGDKPGAKPGDMPSDKPSDKPSDMPGDGQGDQPGDMPGTKPGEKPGEKPGDMSGDQPGSKPGQKPGPKSGEKPGDKPGEKPSEKPQDGQPNGAGSKPGEKPHGKPGEKPNGDGEGEPNSTPSEKSAAKPGEKPQEKPGEKPGEKASAGESQAAKPSRPEGGAPESASGTSGASSDRQEPGGGTGGTPSSDSPSGGMPDGEDGGGEGRGTGRPGDRQGGRNNEPGGGEPGAGEPSDASSDPAEGGASGEDAGRGGRPTSTEKLHDGDAFERALEYLQSRGQKDPAGRPGSKPDSGQAPKPESTDGSSAGEATAGEKPPSGGASGKPTGGTQTKPERAPPGSKPDGRSNDAPPGTGENGESGAGEKPAGTPSGAPSALKKPQDRPKSQQPDDRNSAGGAETATPSESEKQSDSKGGAGGDRAGGGKPGGGQGAKQAGNDSAGSNSPGDEGAGAAPEQGRGPDGVQAGNGKPADKPTGAPGDGRPGAGSNSKPGSGDRPGAGAPKPPGPDGRPPEPAGDERPGTKPQDGAAPPPGTGGPNRATTGGGKPGGETGGSPVEAGAVPEGDAANLEYARRATELVLEKLRDQQDAPDPELLDKLGWTPEDLRQFLTRWEQLREAAERPDADARRELDESLRSLGLRPARNTQRAAAAGADSQRGNQESGGRSAPPSKYAEQFKAYRKGTTRTDAPARPKP